MRGLNARGTVVLDATQRSITIFGNAITVPQNAAQAEGDMPFSLPAQPSHFPGMGMPAFMVVAAGGFEPISSACTERTTSPVTRASDSPATTSLRAILRHMNHKIATVGCECQSIMLGAAGRRGTRRGLGDHNPVS
jgi:hypothetical protein